MSRINHPAYTSWKLNIGKIILQTHIPQQILNALITNLFINKVSAECK